MNHRRQNVSPIAEVHPIFFFYYNFMTRNMCHSLRILSKSHTLHFLPQSRTQLEFNTVIREK